MINLLNEINEIDGLITNKYIKTIDINNLKDEAKVKQINHTIERLFDIKDGKLIEHRYEKKLFAVNFITYDVGFFEKGITKDEFGADEPYKSLITRWQFIDEESRNRFYEANKDKFSSFNYTFEKLTGSKYFETSTVKYLGCFDVDVKENGYNDKGYWKPEIEQRHTIIE